MREKSNPYDAASARDDAVFGLVGQPQQMRGQAVLAQPSALQFGAVKYDRHARMHPRGGARGVPCHTNPHFYTSNL